MLAILVVSPPSFVAGSGTTFASLGYVQSTRETLALGYVLAAVTFTRPDFSRLQPDLEAVGPQQEALSHFISLWNFQAPVAEVQSLCNSGIFLTSEGVDGVQRRDLWLGL